MRSQRSIAVGNRFHRDRRERSRRHTLSSRDFGGEASAREGSTSSHEGKAFARDAFLSALFESPNGRRDKPDHKTQMLCRQVQRTLMLAFGGEVDGADLTDLSVGDVHPAPNAGHLVVEVIVSKSATEPTPVLMARLSAITPRLRHLLAQSISRKRVPELSFVPVAEGGAQ